MARKEPQPRRCKFFGIETPALRMAHGTWLEPEELTYPSGAKIRRARAIDKDTGKLRVVRCGLSDTWFSVEAVGGFLMIDDNEDSPTFGALIFYRYKKEDQA
jgi:hypothetical protein